MSFFRRLFSADYRAAVSAEAAGQFEQAAERYALAGDRAGAARAHLARARRADRRAEQIDALRDALHWAADDAVLTAEISGRLGAALLARARAEGIATEKDRQRVREAARFLVAGGACLEAGEALEEIGDHQAAARAFRDGGLVERMEDALTRDQARLDRERSVRDAFAGYEVHLRIGDRDAARAALAACVAAADGASDYRRLLDDLDARRITGGRVVLRRRGGTALDAAGSMGVTGREIILCRADPARPIAIGRDPLCELPLRAAGISRRHAEILVAGPALALGSGPGRLALAPGPAGAHGLDVSAGRDGQPASPHGQNLGPDGGGSHGDRDGTAPAAWADPDWSASRAGVAAAPRFQLRDAGSRNGTLIGGMPVAGAVPLSGAGRFSLGDDCAIEFFVLGPDLLVLAVATGLDRGVVLIASAADDPVDLADVIAAPGASSLAGASALAGDPIAARAWFRDGRPMIEPTGPGGLRLNGELLAHGAAQLIRGDQLVIAGVEVDVA